MDSPTASTVLPFTKLGTTSTDETRLLKDAHLLLDRQRLSAVLTDSRPETTAAAAAWDLKNAEARSLLLLAIPLSS